MFSLYFSVSCLNRSKKPLHILSTGFSQLVTNWQSKVFCCFSCFMNGWCVSVISVRRLVLHVISLRFSRCLFVITHTNGYAWQISNIFSFVNLLVCEYDSSFLLFFQVSSSFVGPNIFLGFSSLSHQLLCSCCGLDIGYK